MRPIQRLLGCAALLAAALLVAPGCSSGSGDGKDGKKGDDKAQKDKKEGGDKKETDKKGEPEHPEKGPHGGALAEWGKEEYHPEFMQDKGKKQVTVYILDGTAKKAAPIDAKEITLTLKGEKPPVQVTLKADPDKDDPKGSASRFTATHDKFAKEIDPDEVEASAEVKGKPYAGVFKPHDHKHEKK